ncbi:hypothetical protein PHYBLDRAFT_80589 [Phycomyces blakesleeanus NRRL 1555(-)]|uniref:Uncharacterized protein n=1 Tax=Phycomyces blakesleeanus (strain ATCC 8743b / DSM 1359 / FGSC 10004 / NBRC 33097 / NRRL 1555) TaxID=763407 RepID=A0A162N896_PHYB8|nr:hypothetical protein PHYBLDRAFT_80589 [Phycomyces blakesleeanus NRRL 1555(-)]OAD66734.1 hypothetical protein PHYBLDRAFT_80589 [Phycomyces blakesleeanus NRRL 1555(-)]|eukprot:XP_018284774.1 hypothetical protein PHYBLDRAFT_80589 [Phycomyces blakesleeanus NRRL 1555(-)]
MPNGRKLKTKLKGYTAPTATINHSAETKRHADEHQTISVTAKLAKMRFEQGRAEMNRQKRQDAQGTSSAPISFHSPAEWTFSWESTPEKSTHNAAAVTAAVTAMSMASATDTSGASTATHRAPAGPPPPPSWLPKPIVATPRRKTEDISYITKRTFTSLRVICAHEIAKSLKTWHSSAPGKCARYFSALPMTAKEIILQEFSALHRLGYNGLPDQFLYLFGGHDHYTHLCLEGSSVSLNKLIQVFWRARPEHARPKISSADEDSLADDWEDAIEDKITDNYNNSDNNGESGSNDYDHNHNNSSIHFYTYDPEDQENENFYSIQDILRVILGRSMKPNQPYRLFTPLSTQLVSLNLSFVRPVLPSVALAHLLCATLPNLLSLSTAGTFGPSEGPLTLRILSQGLQRLHYWDIGYHDWITADILCGYTSKTVIHWAKDLRDLRVLALQSAGPNNNVGTDVANWIADPPPEDRLRHLKRIKVICK